jgi:dihydropteroate synthase
VTRLRALERHNKRVQIMGIVNRTPDSFFDGGNYLDDDHAQARIKQLLDDGVDIIDVGAESTRPGAAAVSAAEQIRRLGDVVRVIVDSGVLASVDTSLPEVAAHALEQGASMINSVSLDTADALGRLAARHDADLVLTHCRDAMSEMKGFGQYADDGYHALLDEVVADWQQAAEAATDAGLDASRLIFDPGLGFAKNTKQSLQLCVYLGEIKQRLGVRVLVGPSRKSYIAMAIADKQGGEVAPPSQRLGGSIAAALDLARRGADILRVHDVAEVRQALSYQQVLEEEEAALRSQLGSMTTPGTEARRV